MGYYVEEGKAITSKRGIRAPHDEVRPEYLAGGEDACKDFVASGHLYKADRCRPEEKVALAAEAKRRIESKAKAKAQAKSKPETKASK